MGDDTPNSPTVPRWTTTATASCSSAHQHPSYLRGIDTQHLLPQGPPAKSRPVVVLTRPEVIDLLRTVTVAPITATIHGAPSEVIVGSEEKLRHVCRALGIALGCR
jgi:hypothetical protein